ncbi:hypothetical protein Tco_0511074 [Tanacetum coccineum]
MRSFQTKQSVNKINVSDGLFKQVTQQNLPQIRKQAVRNTNVIAPGPSRNCPKHVSHQSPREIVGSNDMVHNYYLEKAKKSAQLQKDKEVNGKPSMIHPVRLPNTANGCKPKPRNWQASMSSRVSNKDVHLGEHRKQKPFLKFNELQCPTCKKCLYSANHDECVLEYLSRLNTRASAQNKDAKSHKTTKRYMPVEKSSASKKPERQIPTGHRFSNKKTTTVPEKTMNPRSCLRWKPTGRIFSNVRLRWIPTGKLLNSCTGKVDSEPTHGSIVDIPHIQACKQTLGLSAGTSFNGQKQQRIDITADALYNEKQENLRVCSDLAPQRQMVSAENNTSGPVPQFKFKAGSKSCSLSKQDSYITTRVGITIPPSHSNAEDNSHKVVRLGINPMIQPEPEDLPKDNPKLEIASSLVAEVSSALALLVLRRLGSIFTSVYAAKLKRIVSLLEGLQGGKKIALCQKYLYPTHQNSEGDPGHGKPQHQQLLSVKKEDRRSYGLGDVDPSGKGYPPEQPEERFSKETYHPLGVIDLRVTMREAGRNKMVLMEFLIVKCRSPYNVIIGRTRMRSLEAVGSTIHSMIKFPTNQGIVTIETSREALWKCRQLERVQGWWKEVQWRQREEQMSRIREQAILRTKSSSGHWPNQGLMPLEETWDKENTEEILTISQERQN